MFTERHIILTVRSMFTFRALFACTCLLFAPINVLSRRNLQNLAAHTLTFLLFFLLFLLFASNNKLPERIVRVQSRTRSLAPENKLPANNLAYLAATTLIV